MSKTIQDEFSHLPTSGQRYYYRNRRKVLKRAKDWQAKEKNFCRSMFTATKANAKRRGIEFNLDQTDFVIPDICPILKVPFKKYTWHAPSVDRIDNTKGYVKGNIQIISRKANTMKSNATDVELKSFADWVYSIV